MSDIQKRILAGDVRFLARDSRLERIAKEQGECMVCKEVFQNEKK
jgi:hypothetical protein